MTDLWPNNIVEVLKITPPVTILRQQAALLGKKTKNIVEAEVASIERDSGSPKFDFAYGFYIVGPALNYYRFLLFRIYHNIDLYPLTVYAEVDMIEGTSLKYGRTSGGIAAVEAKSEEEFLEVLKVIFNSSKAKRVISAILAQSAPGFDLSASDDADEN